MTNAYTALLGHNIPVVLAVAQGTRFRHISTSTGGAGPTLIDHPYLPLFTMKFFATFFAVVSLAATVFGAVTGPFALYTRSDDPEHVFP